MNFTLSKNYFFERLRSTFLVTTLTYILFIFMRNRYIDGLMPMLMYVVSAFYVLVVVFLIIKFMLHRKTVHELVVFDRAIKIPRVLLSRKIVALDKIKSFTQITFKGICIGLRINFLNSSPIYIEKKYFQNEESFFEFENYLRELLK